MAARLTIPDDVKRRVHLTHERAMAAKQAVFLAQDALSLAMSDAAEVRDVPTQRAAFRLLDKLAKRLAQARRALEQFDNESLGAE